MNRSIKKIMVSIAGSEMSIVTAKYAICLAKLLNAELYVIYVVDMKSLEDLLRAKIFVKVEEVEFEMNMEDNGQNYLKRIKQLAEKKGVEAVDVLAKGVINEEVTNKIKELGIDLLVMGELKHVTSRIDVIYNEAEQIFRTAPCSVVVVKDHAAVEAMYEELG